MTPLISTPDRPSAPPPQEHIRDGTAVGYTLRGTAFDNVNAAIAELLAGQARLLTLYELAGIVANRAEAKRSEGPLSEAEEAERSVAVLIRDRVREVAASVRRVLAVIAGDA